MTKFRRFYVYSISIDGRVRYIGYGSGRRVWSHLDQARRINDKRARGVKIRKDPKFRSWKTKHNKKIAIANNARPEKKKQQSSLMKKLNSDPEFTRLRIIAMRKALRDPVIAKRRLERRMNTIAKLARE